MSVKTPRVTDRRTLRFGRMEDILRDAETISVAEEIRTTGNWTAAQIIDHVADLIVASLDGMPRGSWWMRLMGLLLKSSALNRPMRPGFKIPAAFRDIVPPSDITLDAAMDKLRTAIGRLQKGEKMTVPSSFLGPLEHEEWVQLHCRHAELHFSFMHPAGG